MLYRRLLYISTLRLLISLHYFLLQCVMLFFFFCGCSLVSLPCYYRLIEEKKKHSLFCVSWFFSVFHSYPFCVLLSWMLRTFDARGLTVWIRYIMFCLPSLMMFAIYIKIQSLNYSLLPQQQHFWQGNTATDIGFKRDRFDVACQQKWIISSHIIKHEPNEESRTPIQQTFTLTTSIVQIVGWVRDPKTYRLKSRKTQFARAAAFFRRNT